MHSLIQQFPNQLTDASSKFRNLNLKKPEKTIKNIVCCGMGGSGIAGTFIEKLGNKYLKVPYTTCKDYDLPNFVDENTLTIISSHSGNTEETISALNQAFEKKANIVCIASGGKIFDFAKKNSLNLIELPGGMMPRACYTYAIVAQLYLLQSFELINLAVTHELENSIDLIKKFESDFKNIAQDLAQSLFQKTPLIYTDPIGEPVALRFRQQLNENSKILGFTSVIPEMNHNEILGWKDKYENILPIFLRHDYENSRNTLRMELSKKIISEKVEKISELKAFGTTLLEQLFSLIYITDRVSVYLADKRKVDPTEIEIINFLKSELGK